MEKPYIIEFEVHRDPTGNLYVANEKDIPFQVRRSFWITELNYSRGSHALKTCEQVIMAVTGGFTVDTFNTDGELESFKLEYPGQGLYLPTMIWRVMKQFRFGSSAFVWCSHPYDIDDYIQDFDVFLEAS